MDKMFDEISLKYWDTHKEKIGTSKSYTCIHNGYVYGDDMLYEKLEFVHIINGNEKIYPGINSGPKWAYFQLVEASCSQSERTFYNFIHASAEKFRIYTEDEVRQFSKQKINSTRIKDDSSKVIINGKNYYVANNLKICEYFNSASTNIDVSELDNWYIRIYCTNGIVKTMSDRNEVEVVDKIDVNSFNLHLDEESDAKSAMIKRIKAYASKAMKIDFNKINADKKKVGDLGEKIVLQYEYQRLLNANRRDLAKKIEHSAEVKGDGLGYDISSYAETGEPLYIEVKTTRQNNADNFYLSKKEKACADEMSRLGKYYLIYRIYKLNTHTGYGKLKIYEAPFTDSEYDMEPENWLVRIKKNENPLIY